MVVEEAAAVGLWSWLWLLGEEGGRWRVVAVRGEEAVVFLGWSSRAELNCCWLGNHLLCCHAGVQPQTP